MAYDPDHSQVVMFGGRDFADEQPANETWTWDGFNWTKKNPIISPSPRFSHTMAYDSARHEVVLFGGATANPKGGTGQIQNDTWTWDGDKWEKKQPLHSPPIRYRHSMAYDELHGKIILFGGSGRRTADGAWVEFSNEMWAWDGNDWTQLSPGSSPPGLYEGAMAYDDGRNCIILSGGWIEATDPNNPKVFRARSSVTWVWDGSNWFQKSQGVPVVLHALACDKVHNNVVLLGGEPTNNNTWVWGAAPPPPADIDFTIVGNMRIAQVIFDPDINADGRKDLVKGKNALALISVTSSSFDPNDDRQLLIKATMGGQTVSEKTVRAGSINAASKVEGLEVELYYTPSVLGEADLEITLDPLNSIAESDENNNNQSKKVDVKETRPLRIGYFRISECAGLWSGCYGPLAESEFDESLTESNKFIKATYPLAEQGLITSFKDSFLGATNLGGGYVLDLLNMWLYGKVNDPNMDKAIGIVPKDYFEYHWYDKRTVGLTFPNGWAAVVTAAYWSAGAHELGHMLGVKGCEPNCSTDGREEYEINPPGNSASGFFVNDEESVQNSICFMGDGEPRQPVESLRRWVDNEHYQQLFAKLLTVADDPEILLVSGLINKNGSISFQPFYFLPEGSATESEPGNFAIRVLDGAGDKIAEVGFDITFQIYVDPIGVQSTDTVPFMAAIPYPPTAASVEIVREGQVLWSISSNAKLLYDAINAIPDFGFDQNPDQRRNALLNKVLALQSMLSAGNIIEALEKLHNDIKKHIDEWLLEGYVKSKPIELEKKEVLALVDAIVTRLENNAK